MAVDRGRQKDVQTRRIVPTTGDPASSSGLVASPVVLAVVSLAVVPWVAFAARTDVAGRLVSRAVSVAAWVAAGLILALNAALVVSVVRGQRPTEASGGGSASGASAARTGTVLSRRVNGVGGGSPEVDAGSLPHFAAPAAYAMLDHRIDPSEWGAFFDHISRHVRDIPDYGAARVFAVRPGDFPGEREEAWRDLIGVTWEPKKDTITVALDGLDHRIMEPRAVWSDEPVGGHVGHVIVVGAEERRDEIVFRRVGDMADMES